ncbi:hypothetical protein [Streptomyces filamentosus]|uniref:hypothetical protein n=1 Tax=Streptomyces filamentosus TaxID=67294 RepID=UPI0033F2C44E
MPENTVAAPLTPMEPNNVADAFACLRTILTDDMDTACPVTDNTGPELDQLLLDIAPGTVIPATATDDHDGELSERSVPARAHWVAECGPERAAVRKRTRRPRPNREVRARG